MDSTAKEPFDPPSGAAAVGWIVRVFWERDDTWFQGIVVRYNSSRGFLIKYDDGDLLYSNPKEESVRFLRQSRLSRMERMMPSPPPSDSSCSSEESSSESSSDEDSPMLRIKWVFSDDLLRVTLAEKSEINLPFLKEEARKLLLEQFVELNHGAEAMDFSPNILLEYIDEESDWISLFNDSDLKIALSLVSSKKVLKLFVRTDQSLTASTTSFPGVVMDGPRRMSQSVSLPRLGVLSDTPESIVRPQSSVEAWRHRTLRALDLEAPMGTEPEPITNWKRGQILGAGAFGKVYSALCLRTGEILAVKQVSCSDEKRVAALEKEIELLKQLRHENIVSYRGTQRKGKKLFVFLEYCSGGSLSSHLASFGCFSEAVVRRYAWEICKGLEFLHRASICHRDLKLSNVLLDKSGVCRLADFGSSVNSSGDSDLHTAAGTIFYSAPEVLQASHEKEEEEETSGYGVKSDVWSLGICVMELSLGKLPWSNPASYIFKIMTESPPIPDVLSLDGQNFLELCFTRDPHLRPSAEKLLLHPFLEPPEDQMLFETVMVNEEEKDREPKLTDDGFVTAATPSPPTWVLSETATNLGGEEEDSYSDDFVEESGE